MSETNKKPGDEPGKVPAYGVMKSAAPGEKVTVACKLPQGLVLQLYQEVEIDEPVMGGGVRRTKQHIPIPGKRVELAGTGYPINMTPYAPIVGAKRPGAGEGFALTSGVDADFWNEWCRQNKGSPLLESGVLFADIKPVYVEGIAKERIDLRSGLEPLLRDSQGQIDDPRNVPSSNRMIGKVSTADRTPSSA